MKPKHDNGKPDTRYTVTLEHTGQVIPYHVARFMGEWVAASADKREAWAHCMAHQRQRLEQHTGGAQ